jgi:hypothetical protein
MKTIEQINAEIAALQAEREARKSEPDLSEALAAYREAFMGVGIGSVWQREKAGLIAAYPALHKVLAQSAPEPTEAEDLAMAQDVFFRSFDYLGHVADVIVAAFKAERKRAGGG